MKPHAWLLPLALLGTTVVLVGQAPLVPASPPAATEAKKAPSDTPRVEIDPKGRTEFGSLGPVERKQQTYRLTNTSAKPIQMKLKELPKGVMVEGPAFASPIPPGASLALTMTVEAQERTGVHSVRAILTTDDPEQGLYFLPIQYVVRPDLAVDRERQTLQDVGPHESRAAEFTFKRETKTPFELKLATELPAYLEPEIQGEGGTSVLRVVLRPAKVPDGMRMGLETFRVQTSAPQQSAFTLYLAWNLAYPVEAKPTRVVFLDPKVTAQGVTLTSKDGKPFRIAEARVEGEGFILASPQPTQGPSAEFTLRRTTTRKASATLVVRFEDGIPSLRIPLSYRPPEL